MTATNFPVCPGCGWTQGTCTDHIPCVERAYKRIAKLEADLAVEAADADSAVDSVVAKVKWYHEKLGNLEYRLEKAEAELEAQKALLPVVPAAQGGKS